MSGVPAGCAADGFGADDFGVDRFSTAGAGGEGAGAFRAGAAAVAVELRGAAFAGRADFAEVAVAAP